eukprot:TRINITY_DN5597_c0_g8_i1.p1 TRINITY_DN5597_c0_g8~~TRINITY_DN5597_c0_g8_i1.p1  ORF type:complete len:130 (+),score=18.45 TRINITY_DN5597_c0_g8_i1:1-390(+)
MGLYGFKISNPSIVSAYYYNKMIQILLRPVIEITDFCQFYNSQAYTAFIIFITIFKILSEQCLHTLQAYVLYLYVNLLASGDEEVDGREQNPMEMADQYGRSALVLESYRRDLAVQCEDCEEGKSSSAP